MVYVLDRSKTPKAYLLRPNTIQAQIPHLATLLATHPFPATCVHGAIETSSNELKYLFACCRESLSSSYTSHDFVTVGHTYAITMALQPPTSIYKGLLAVPKVESTLPLNPHSLISTDLRVGVPGGTPPAVPRSILDAFDHHSNHHIQRPGSHLLIRYDQWRRLWEHKLSPFLKLLKTKAFQKNYHDRQLCQLTDTK
jgi:hypothetical protein